MTIFNNDLNTAQHFFKQNGFLLAKDVLELEQCKFFTHVLLRNQFLQEERGDQQVPFALAKMDHSVMFDTLQERIWPLMEAVTGLELYPTYSYARLYTNGNVLQKHSDRPECEISITLQLGRSHHYAWPIYMNGVRCDLAEGQGVIYRGCDLEHWRDTCDGPPDYYSGQVFMHYVNANGPYFDRAGDNNIRENLPSMYVKHRTFMMDSK